ncbi:MAG: hypothetical protein H7329_20960 [Opitutaceae bacterium]|nr:hypothetical protein [Cytophagales bacterium]
MLALKEEFQMEEMKIKFGGDTHQVEANTFLNTLLPFVTLVQEVSKELDPSKRVEIKINAEPKPGSFIIDLIIETSIAVDAVKHLFTKETLGFAADVVGVVGGIYGLAHFLKGKKPQTIETTDNSVKIVNESGKVTYIDNRVFQIYSNNKAVQHSITQSFEALSNDASVTSFELQDKNEKTITEIPKEDFGQIANIEDEIIAPNERVEPTFAFLNIVSMDWELKKKWDFYFQGNKISAKITDNTFREAIDKGEQFSKGDSLEVKMDIKQVFDESVDTFVNRSYLITKIIKHHPRGEQKKLF